MPIDTSHPNEWVHKAIATRISFIPTHVILAECIHKYRRSGVNPFFLVH